MSKPKIIVVGAGPAGGACALELARSKSASVTLLDRSTYPRLKVCGSGLSPHALAQLRSLGIASRFERQALRMPGIIARGPEGGTIRLRGATGAWIVPRTEFDHGLVAEAVRAGAEFREGTRVDALLRNGAGEACGVITPQGDLEADLVVCANGSPSRFEHDPRPRAGIRTIMGWWTGAELSEADMGVMIWDRRLEGYYAWAFPEPGGIVNIGLTIADSAARSQRLRQLFEEILDEHFSGALRSADRVGRWQGHPVTVTTRIGDITERRAIWIGEAARLVSPGTVEGIGFAIESGALAGRILARHASVRAGLPRVHQAAYRAQLAARVIPKFWAGEALRNLMRSTRPRRIAAKWLMPHTLAAHASRILGERPTPNGASPAGVRPPQVPRDRSTVTETGGRVVAASNDAERPSTRWQRASRAHSVGNGPDLAGRA